MPYYWQRIKDLYDNHPDDNWQTSPGAILSDLAWHFIDEDDTPDHLHDAVYEADEGDSEWRLPHPDEICAFKQWIDQILASEVSQGWRDKLMETIFSGSRPMSSVEASTILHLAPCAVIQEFIQKTQRTIDDFNQSEGSYASDNTEETIIVQLPISNLDSDDSEEEDYDSMPELEEDDSAMDIDTDDEEDLTPPPLLRQVAMRI